MKGLRLALLLLFVGSIGAANFRDLTKRILVGSILGYSWMNESHVYNWTGQMFNKMTCENEMKWAVYEPERGKINHGPADLIVEYAEANKMKVRGHTLVWHQQLPPWVKTLNKTELHTVMITRIKEMMTRYKGKIYAYDVVNEVWANDGKGLKKTIWFNALKDTYVPEAFHLARKMDPAAKLYINEYGVEGNNSKTVSFFNYVKTLKSQGVPIDGVSFQCHFKAGHVPADFQKVLEWFSTLDVDVGITELDIGIANTSAAQLKQQASDYPFVYNSCENVKRCVSVTAWGFTDKFSWLKPTKPCMWDEDFKPKPAVAAVEAVLK